MSGRNRSGSIIRFIIETVKTVLVAIIIALVLNNFVVANMEVSTGSMEPTIMTGDRVLFNRLAYINSSPQRYDIVVFRYPFDDIYYNENFVKRIIGLPGDRVEIIGGMVYINHSATPMNDSFTRFIGRNNYGPYYVPEGSFFVLGDNRDHSSDSRHWVSPFIEESRIMGKAWLRYYPSLGIVQSS